ncbi:MAG: DUF448 domain-containing protein [Desulfocapsa sp.]|nr:DUF448 domain-containing protein [Desulfocapsa sp.]
MRKTKSTQPIRTCIVCRKHFAKNLLQRYVWESEKSEAVLDDKQIRSGRGAYCCSDTICMERFSNRKQGWKRAFRLK